MLSFCSRRVKSPLTPALSPAGRGGAARRLLQADLDSVIGGNALVGPFQKSRGGGPGGWIFIAEPEIHLGPHVAVPDIAGWRRDRLPDISDARWIETTPDWICEVLSPFTEKYDKGDKRRIYSLYGIPYLWHVDPRARTLEVFRLQERDWLLTHTFVDQEDVSAPPFDAITFSLGLLWPFDTPSTETPSDERR